MRRPSSVRFVLQGVDPDFGAQGIAVVGILVSASDREHAEAQHRRQRVDYRRRIAPVPDAARQRLGQTEPALGLA